MIYHLVMSLAKISSPKDTYCAVSANVENMKKTIDLMFKD